MQKNKLKSLVLITILFGSIVSCKKEAVQNSPVTTSETSALTGSDSVLWALNALPIGTYAGKGSRTVYDGQANKNGDNIKVIMDFFVSKKIVPTADKKHLSCPFGYGFYVDKGWKYIIGYDFKKKQLTLAPNDVMAAEIVPGSFEALYAAYDASSKSFVFQTRFIALEDNGNESEMVEPLGKSE